jgi:arylformamidase
MNGSGVTGFGALLVVAWTVGCASPDVASREDAGPAETPDAASCARRELARLDLRYRELDGVSPALTSLDLYLPARDDCTLAPLVVWVHGGGWQVGDKRNGIEPKRALFVGEGYGFASVNYRLSTEDASPPVRHPDHVGDVAAAVAYLLANAPEHGLDATRVVLLGHSAGGHLVALLGTDPRHLAAAGRAVSELDGVGSYDGAGYDIPREMAQGPNPLYLAAFGDDPEVWRDASPQHHAADVVGSRPHFQLARRGTPERRDVNDDFAAALAAAGSVVDVIDASSLDHEGVQRSLGAAGDEVMTPAVLDFVARCFARDR